jgi:hypothetical protein
VYREQGVSGAKGRAIFRTGPTEALPFTQAIGSESFGFGLDGSSNENPLLRIGRSPGGRAQADLRTRPASRIQHAARTSVPGQGDLGVAGPLARHASDLALALEVIAGPDEEHEGIGNRLALPPPRHDDLKNFRVLVIDTHPLMRAVGDRTIGAAPGKIGNQGYADERRGEFSPNGVAIWIFGSGRGKGSPIPGLRRQRRSGARRSGPRKGQQSIDDRGLAPSLQRQPPLGFTKFSRSPGIAARRARLWRSLRHVVEPTKSFSWALGGTTWHSAKAAVTGLGRSSRGHPPLPTSALKIGACIGPPGAPQPVTGGAEVLGDASQGGVQHAHRICYASCRSSQPMVVAAIGVAAMSADARSQLRKYRIQPVMAPRTNHSGIERKPSKFEDQYEDALKELLKKKQEGKPIERPDRPKPTNVVNLMDALRQSVEASDAATSTKGKPRAASPRSSAEKTEHPKPKRTRRSG